MFCTSIGQLSCSTNKGNNTWRSASTSPDKWSHFFLNICNGIFSCVALLLEKLYSPLTITDCIRPQIRWTCVFPSQPVTFDWLMPPRLPPPAYLQQSMMKSKLTHKSWPCSQLHITASIGRELYLHHSCQVLFNIWTWRWKWQEGAKIWAQLRTLECEE